MNSSELSSSLRAVVSALYKGLRKQLYSVDTYSMTELETIKHIAKNTSLLPSELAALTRIKTQSMSQILNKLEKQDVIKRTTSTEDKRKVSVSLTDSGVKFVEQARYDRDEWLKELIEKSLTEDEKTLLANSLPVLHKLIKIN
jgi:DNA-binding MarR family transcriptional regulator